MNKITWIVLLTISNENKNVYTRVYDYLMNYPPEPYWGLDPSFSVPTSWHIKDIKSMIMHPLYPVLFYHQHPVMNVQIQGTITHLVIKDKFTKYTIDDTTGIISCILWNKCTHDHSTRSSFPIGSYVAIIGTIQEYNDDLELSITFIESIINDSISELIWHKEVANRKCFLEKNLPIKHR